jgi:hypothetical protein
LTKSKDAKKLIFLQLNEINFDIVRLYISRLPSRFPGFEKLLSCRGIHTSSEECYETLEPWIQWVSVHTGKSYSEHNIFRLGDIVGSPINQIFEQLELSGFTVGAISPMNAENRLKNPAYFIPDPWTKTLTDRSWWSKRLGASISQAVNDNSQAKISLKNALFILLGLVRFAKFRHYFLYFKLIFKSIMASWPKSLALDLLLHDIHTTYFDEKNPHFSTLFLNAGAHIQHHYFYNSPFVSSQTGIKNPNWYISNKYDPFYEMLDVYDCIVNEYLTSDRFEIVVATGLSQRPYDRIKYYYRLKDHLNFLKKIGIRFLNVYPRMARDFLVIFASSDDAIAAQKILGELRIFGKSELLFGEIDNRGNELFITFTYPNEIVGDDILDVGTEQINLTQEVVFVAIKNGMHQSKGFVFFTPGIAEFSPPNESHVKNLYYTLINYFNA